MDDEMRNVLGTTSRLTSRQWINLINKNPEKFGVSRSYVSSIDKVMRQADEELNKKPGKLGRPNKNNSKVSEYMKKTLIENGWILISEFKDDIARKFEVSSSKVENEYFKFVETNKALIERKMRKGKWYIRNTWLEGEDK